jgi:hypothetical protein
MSEKDLGVTGQPAPPTPRFCLHKRTVYILDQAGSGACVESLMCKDCLKRFKEVAQAAAQPLTPPQPPCIEGLAKILFAAANAELQANHAGPKPYWEAIARRVGSQIWPTQAAPPSLTAPPLTARFLEAAANVASKLESQVLRDPSLPEGYKAILREYYAARDAMENEFEDWFDDDYEEEEEFDCGETPDGGCVYAGTELCDWECPNSSRMMQRLAIKTKQPPQG